MKKGSIAEETIHLIMIVILIIIVGVGIITLIQSALNKKVDSFPVESAIFIEQILHSKGGMCLFDPATGQVRQGEIDYDRVREQEYSAYLEKAINTEHPLSARMTIKGQTLPESVIYYHKDDFDKAIVYHGAGVSGVGSVYWKEQRMPVILRSGTLSERGVLVFEIALPKSLKAIP